MTDARKPNLGAVLVTDAKGAATAFSGAVGKFGALHPRLAAALWFAAGIAAAVVPALLFHP